MYNDHMGTGGRVRTGQISTHPLDPRTLPLLLELALVCHVVQVLCPFGVFLLGHHVFKHPHVVLGLVHRSTRSPRHKVPNLDLEQRLAELWIPIPQPRKHHKPHTKPLHNPNGKPREKLLLVHPSWRPNRPTYLPHQSPLDRTAALQISNHHSHTSLRLAATITPEWGSRAGYAPFGNMHELARGRAPDTQLRVQAGVVRPPPGACRAPTGCRFLQVSRHSQTPVARHLPSIPCF